MKNRSLEKTLLKQDFAERVIANDRINKLRRSRNPPPIQPNQVPAAEAAIGVDVDPNPEPVGEECTYAELSADALNRPRGDFQEWERELKKGVQVKQQQPPQKAPKKAKKPVKSPPAVESPYTTGEEAAPPEVPTADDGVEVTKNEVEDEREEPAVIYADIVGVLK